MEKNDGQPTKECPLMHSLFILRSEMILMKKEIDQLKVQVKQLEATQDFWGKSNEHERWLAEHWQQKGERQKDDEGENGDGCRS